MKKNLFFIVAICSSFLVAGCQTTQTNTNVPLASGQFDGRYGANLAFEMGVSSVCPAALPITIELSVVGGNLTGGIFNDGGDNTDHFCALYHNGTISGKLSEAGELVNVRISQKDMHSAEHSSYRITGNLSGELTLLSHSKQYHPNSLFSVSKR
jgi:hypothetical protein